jgi:hypothetical protein
LNGAQVLESNANSKVLFGFGGCGWKIGNFEQLLRMRLKFKI